ncbi:MAG: apolipoprotein N-acyltransferase, partial [Candidatus Omnitrophica bacterium]|nr:apolipoprotein N-acyltransferase [Candidatus Omnitrophota bacterium]
IISNFLTGFPWLLLGLSQYSNPYILKIAKFIGIYGVSFLIIAFNLFLFTLIKKNFSLQNLFFILFLIFLFLIYKLPERKIYKGSLSILLIQPNIITSQITKEENEKFLISLLNQNLKGKKVDMVILPEGIFQDNLFEKKDLIEKLKKISIQNKCSILFGSFTGFNNNIYNSGVLIKGNKLDVYNKIKLVPYGEFILGERFKFIKNIFLKIAGYQPYLKKGNDFKVFECKNIKFSILICYENVFSQFLDNFLKNGADFFIVITNDSWFGKSIGPYQHFYHNVFRGIETGRYFIQIGLTGVTGIVNPNGKIERILESKGEELFIKGFLFYSLPVFYYETFYSKYGLYPFVLFCLILIGFLICKN